jgi:hypothetical protein
MNEIDITQLSYLTYLSQDTYVLAVSNNLAYRLSVNEIIKGIRVPDKLSLGLGNVNNTSDSMKPVSVYQKEALDKKADINHGHYAAAIVDLDESIAKGLKSQLVMSAITDIITECLKDIPSIGISHDKISGLDDYLRKEVERILSDKLNGYDVMLNGIASRIGMVLESLDTQERTIQETITIVERVESEVAEIDDEVTVQNHQW